jgi:isopropylmalate/homocitrate/citramalate synthase
MNAALRICEVGPRDGLQNSAAHFTVSERAALISDLAAAGMDFIEAVSFVNPARVPQMANAEEVLDLIDVPQNVHLAGLVLNQRGAERAIATRLHEVRFVVVASETFSQRNQGAGIEDTLQVVERMTAQVHQAGKQATGIIAASFGCPFEGEVPRARVADISARLIGSGVDSILFADTIGVGVPADVALLSKACGDLQRGFPFGFHFHNTRNTGYANALTALQYGASVLDAAVGGMGGCPFAPNATGNIATEDLLYMLRRTGLSLDIDMEAMMSIAQHLHDRAGDEVSGQLHKVDKFPVGSVSTPAPAIKVSE